MRKRCERCYGEHDGLFGSGRFCSFACSRWAGGKANKRFAGTRHDWTGKRHSPQTLIKMKDARRLWWEQHECKRKRNDKGQFAK